MADPANVWLVPSSLPLMIFPYVALTSLPDAVVVVAAAPWICRRWVVMLVVVG
jgi:hypothetical protein